MGEVAALLAAVVRLKPDQMCQLYEDILDRWGVGICEGIHFFLEMRKKCRWGVGICKGVYLFGIENK